MCNSLFPLENNFHTAEKNSGNIQRILSFIHVFTNPVKMDLTLMYQQHFSNHELPNPLLTHVSTALFGTLGFQVLHESMSPLMKF